MNNAILLMIAFTIIVFVVLYRDQYKKFGDKLTAFVATLIFVVALLTSLLLLMLFGWAVFNMIF